MVTLLISLFCPSLWAASPARSPSSHVTCSAKCLPGQARAPSTRPAAPCAALRTYFPVRRTHVEAGHSRAPSHATRRLIRPRRTTLTCCAVPTQVATSRGRAGAASARISCRHADLAAMTSAADAVPWPPLGDSFLAARLHAATAPRPFHPQPIRCRRTQQSSARPPRAILAPLMVSPPVLETGNLMCFLVPISRSVIGTHIHS